MTAEEQKKALNEALELVKPIVKRIEASIPSTKNHYGDYMAVLSMDKDPMQMKKMAALLILAGANKEGVSAALKLCL
jgi:RNA binding exosome subunit